MAFSFLDSSPFNCGVDHFRVASTPWLETFVWRSLAIDASSSSPDVNSRWSPVTRFSILPASALGFASPRIFSTYARRLGYLDSGLRGMAAFAKKLAHRVAACTYRVVSERSMFGRNAACRPHGWAEPVIRRPKRTRLRQEGRNRDVLLTTWLSARFSIGLASSTARRRTYSLAHETQAHPGMVLWRAA